MNLFIPHEAPSAAEPRQESPGRAAGREARVLLRGRQGAAVPGVLRGSGRGASAPARRGGGYGGDASRAAQPGSAGPAGARRPARGRRASEKGSARPLPGPCPAPRPRGVSAACHAPHLGSSRTSRVRPPLRPTPLSSSAGHGAPSVSHHVAVCTRWPLHTKVTARRAKLMSRKNDSDLCVQNRRTSSSQTANLAMRSEFLIKVLALSLPPHFPEKFRNMP